MQSNIVGKKYGRIRQLINMPKKPNEVCLQIDCGSKNEAWKVETVLKTIKIEVEARKTNNMNKATVVKNPIPPKLPSTSSALHTGSQVSKCVYCGGEHYSSSCQFVKDIKERHAILLRGGRCFVCLKPQHRAKDCDPNKNCRRCHKCHHQSLCDTVVNKPSTADTKAPPVNKPTATNTTNFIKDKKATLHPTGVVVKHGMRNGMEQNGMEKNGMSKVLFTQTIIVTLM